MAWKARDRRREYQSSLTSATCCWNSEETRTRDEEGLTSEQTLPHQVRSLYDSLIVCDCSALFCWLFENWLWPGAAMSLQERETRKVGTTPRKSRRCKHKAGTAACHPLAADILRARYTRSSTRAAAILECTRLIAEDPSSQDDRVFSQAAGTRRWAVGSPSCRGYRSSQQYYLCSAGEANADALFLSHLR